MTAEMNQHPCHGLKTDKISNEIFVKAFERMANGKHPGVPSNSPIIEVLIERGLIERVQDNIAGDIRFELNFIADYRVPEAVHRRWTEWRAEQNG